MPAVAFGSIIGIVQQILRPHYILFAVFLFLNVLDLITALFVEVKRRRFSSRKLVMGLISKICRWIIIAVSFGLSIALQSVGKSLEVDLSVTTLLGWFVTSVLVIEEARSILAHMKVLGVKVPKILDDILKLTETTLEDRANVRTENKIDKPVKTDGRLIINTSDPYKDIYRLELDEDPSKLSDKKVIHFQVVNEDLPNQK